MATFNVGKDAKLSVESCIFTTVLDLKESDVIETVNNIARGLNTLAETVHDFVDRMAPPSLTIRRDEEVSASSEEKEVLHEEKDEKETSEKDSEENVDD